LFQIIGLSTNKCYEFRVCALNSAGPGPYSANSEPAFARRAPCAPHIDLSMLPKDVTALVGEPFRIAVPFIASPPAKIEWSRDGRDLTSGGRLDLLDADKLATLSNKKSTRDDSGPYTLKLT